MQSSLMKGDLLVMKGINVLLGMLICAVFTNDGVSFFAVVSH